MPIQTTFPITVYIKQMFFIPILDYIWMFDLHKIGDVNSCLFTHSVAAVSLSNNLFSFYHIGSKTLYKIMIDVKGHPIWQGGWN